MRWQHLNDSRPSVQTLTLTSNRSTSIHFRSAELDRLASFYYLTFKRWNVVNLNFIVLSVCTPKNKGPFYPNGKDFTQIKRNKKSPSLKINTVCIHPNYIFCFVPPTGFHCLDFHIYSWERSLFNKCPSKRDKSGVGGGINWCGKIATKDYILDHVLTALSHIMPTWTQSWSWIISLCCPFLSASFYSKHFSLDKRGKKKKKQEN